MGFDAYGVRRALGDFKGVKRRFTITGEARGITVVDDYGHHPVEISAVLSAARLALSGRENSRVIAVVQPHRYTRLRDLFEDFCSRSEEHTSELQSLMRISYAVFCLKKKTQLYPSPSTHQNS